MDLLPPGSHHVMFVKQYDEFIYTVVPFGKKDTIEVVITFLSVLTSDQVLSILDR